ncbi:MAG TPA: hypothetical protein VGK00_07520 [Anaerolineales bacterium]|jgi:hypothetical protein
MDNILAFKNEILGYIFAVILIIYLVLPNYLLSRLLKIEYDDFHLQWEKDGRPHGIPFWFPSEIGSLGFRSYPWFVGYLWLFETPDWIKGHSAASQALKYYRIISWAEYAILLSVCLLVTLLIMYM